MFARLLFEDQPVGVGAKLFQRLGDVLDSGDGKREDHGICCSVGGAGAMRESGKCFRG